MKRDLEALEAELARWQPVPLSDALRGRIEREVSRPVSRPIRRVWFFTSALAAASLLFALFLLQRDEGPARSSGMAASHHSDAASPSTLNDYRWALDRSTDELDDLLSRHASTPINATSSPKAFLHSSLLLELSGNQP